MDTKITQTSFKEVVSVPNEIVHDLDFLTNQKKQIEDSLADVNNKIARAVALGCKTSAEIAQSNPLVGVLADNITKG